MPAPPVEQIGSMRGEADHLLEAVGERVGHRAGFGGAVHRDRLRRWLVRTGGFHGGHLGGGGVGGGGIGEPQDEVVQAAVLAGLLRRQSYCAEPVHESVLVCHRDQVVFEHFVVAHEFDRRNRADHAQSYRARHSRQLSVNFPRAHHELGHALGFQQICTVNVVPG